MIGQQLHAYLRAAAGYERVRVGPFLATFTPGSDHPNRNYAVPDDDIDPDRGQVAELVAVYERRGLRPRLEYASSTAPALARVLVDAGFTIEATIPVLTCEQGQQRLVVADGFAVSDAVDEQDHEAAMRVAAAAFGEPSGAIPAELVAARMAMAAGGGAVAVVRETGTGTGRVVGSGLHPIPVDGVTEVASIGTLAEFRNRGVATAVIGHLATRALQRGVRLVWLTVEHAAERHAAEAAGFRDTGETMVNISRSP